MPAPEEALALKLAPGVPDIGVLRMVLDAGASR
jgi:hypothetical protein